MESVYISVEKNVEVFEFYKKLWHKCGINGIRAGTMTGAIEAALSIERSKTRHLYFIDIVADDIDYMPGLPTLDEVTDAPILIATSNNNEDEHHEALAKGAYFYGPYCEDPAKNIRAVISVVESYNRAKKQKTEMNILTCGGVLVSLSGRKTFVNNTEVELTNFEFNMLCYLISNRGRALSYEQIYATVWDDKYNESSNMAIKTMIKKLRKKITGNEDENNIIENLRGFGYKMSM